MKVLKVVVDELPESCSDCILWIPHWDGNYCDATKMDLQDDWCDKRHDMCPLVKENSYHDVEDVYKEYEESEER